MSQNIVRDKLTAKNWFAKLDLPPLSSMFIFAYASKCELFVERFTIFWAGFYLIFFAKCVQNGKYSRIMALRQILLFNRYRSKFKEFEWHKNSVTENWFFICQQQYKIHVRWSYIEWKNHIFNFKISIVDNFRQQHRTFSRVLLVHVPLNRSPLHSWRNMVYLK